ncbi:MAG TPA: YncE family protein, partial [Gemmatimonadaceae bacterium]|nr:YncE family protein [Gemmatimonadaceae bacterium]
GAVIATRGTHGRGSHMLALSANGGRVAVANVSDGTISILEPGGADSAVVVPVARAVEGIALTPDGRQAWVGSNRDSIVVVVDLAARRSLDSLRGFGLPYRLAVSPDGRIAVVSDPERGEVRAFDAVNRRARWTLVVPRDSLVATAEVPGSPSPEGVAISRDSRWVFVTLQGRNRLATIDLSRGRLVRLSPTGAWSDGVAFSPVSVTR